MQRTPRRWTLTLGTAAAGVALVLTPAAGATPVPVAQGGDDPAPLLGTGEEHVIDGQFIVVLEPDATRADVADATEVAEDEGGEVIDTYDDGIAGFAAELPPDAVAELRTDPDVAFIEADQRVEVSASQRGATWGLDRVDQRRRVLDRRYDYDRTGSGVTAYVIDTGIRAGHRQFGGRVKSGFTSVRDGRGTGDCEGHGTHVAGTIGSARYGVAKRVTLRPVRVLGCGGYGSNSSVIAGIEWVTRHHTTGPAVANLSLGGSVSAAMDLALERSVADGVTYVVAAGNEDWNACQFSPARASSALTVGATTKRDARWRWSNYGPCVDLFAPGTDIVSTWHRTSTATRTLSGTSMASPHVAGAAALYLQGFPAATPDEVSEALLGSATTGRVTGRRGSPDRLLFSRTSAPPLTASDNLLANADFEAGPGSGWTSSTGVVTTAGRPARSGAWKALLGGAATEHRDFLRQSVEVPAARSARLTFHLRTVTNEGVYEIYDTLTVKVNGVVLRTFSNTDRSSTYLRHTLDLRRFAGQTVTLSFDSREDSSVATSFYLDDVAVVTLD